MCRGSLGSASACVAYVLHVKRWAAVTVMKHMEGGVAGGGVERVEGVWNASDMVPQSGRHSNHSLSSIECLGGWGRGDREVNT